ncbi:MAG: YifB family Mg chelatase-like AAA ATPase [Pseudomonadota bacterium]
MIASTTTVAFQGIQVLPIDVQVHIRPSSLPTFKVVGLPDKAVGESKERVHTALHAIGLSLPGKRIVVNLSPADLQKEGNHYDLPIAIALLVGMNVLPADEIAQYTSLGELALDGSISYVSGVLPAAINASSRDHGLICPADCGGEAAWASDLQILAVSNLIALINHFKGTQVLSQPEPKLLDSSAKLPDLADIKGQGIGKRALEITAAGGHNLLMCGPPGAGKSMMAARLPSLLPSLSPEEALEVTMIHSVAGHLEGKSLIQQRPYRDPHHSASLPSLVGGGLRAKPGEASLAHRGVLFLDELPEFQRNALEALRQPMETGRTTIARANAHVTYPARFQLIAAMNPCRCGHIDDPDRACTRAPKCALNYQARISGPLLDRIDLQIDVPAVKVSDLHLHAAGEPSTKVRTRVESARAIQRQRYHSKTESLKISTNAEADGTVLMRHALPDEQGQKLLMQATEKFKLSARGYHRILRVARTLADLEGYDGVRSEHVAEALGYRRVNV